MNEKIIDKIEDFLESLHTEVDVLYNVDVEEIDLDDPYNSIYEMLDDKGAFDIEIIYYSRAMEYLTENDNSLQESLGIADEYGYSPSNLNSEILASLLASRLVREEFADLETTIEDFFSDIRDEIEELENNALEEDEKE